MNKLTDTMKLLITNFNAASVATVNPDGTPAVSPKATFVIIDDHNIAFGNIRSPGTVANIQLRPDVELNFIDVLARRAVRIKGQAKIVDKDSEDGVRMTPVFRRLWEPYLDVMQNFVSISIIDAKIVTSPGYDIGLTASELQKTNLDKLVKIAAQES